MAATIQEGQMSAPTQGLFQGKSFWLSMRVPMRSRFVQQIKANGGNVVVTEKDADILIVDHLKEHSGDTAFSYKFIEKSIENKKLEDLDDHRVVPVQKKKASKASGLRGRNFFTQEDDDILFKKIASVDSGYNGNKIYQELHEKYPHHTMHSWRGRWVDHFSKLKDSESRLEQLKEEMEQGEAEPEEESEQVDLTQSDEEPEVIPVKNGLGTFTKDDEAFLQKMAVEILKSSDAIYEKLSKRNPRHTPKEWRSYFTNIMLPRIARDSIVEPLNGSNSKSKDRHNKSEGEEQPVALTSGEKVVSKSGQEIKETLEPTSNSKRKQPQLPVNTKSPLRTMSVRDPPRSWSKEGNKPLADLQPHKSAANSSIGRATSTMKGDTKAVDETITAEIPQDPLQQAQRQKDEIQSNKGKDSDITPLSHDKAQSDVPQNSQKRKREKEIFAPEQRKRKRNFHDIIESTPEAEPTTQSRILSPELGESSQKSTPPVAKNKKDKKYGQMSTQALYDQLDEGELRADMEFPELELPSTPTSPVAPPPPPEEKHTPPSKPLPKAPASAWESSPILPNDDDSNSIIEISAFLDYCQEKFRTSEHSVIDAIERTGGVRFLVEEILRCDVSGKALPDLPGIWTREQDQILLGADSKMIKELAEIKGEELMLKRMEFLNMWNRA